jgi:hypothetical protein
VNGSAVSAGMVPPARWRRPMPASAPLGGPAHLRRPLWSVVYVDDARRYHNFLGTYAGHSLRRCVTKTIYVEATRRVQREAVDRLGFSSMSDRVGVALGQGDQEPVSPSGKPALTCCAPEEIRTPNLLIRSQMLYPLSYGRSCPTIVHGRSVQFHFGGSAARCSSLAAARLHHCVPFGGSAARCSSLAAARLHHCVPLAAPLLAARPSQLRGSTAEAPGFEPGRGD